MESDNRVARSNLDQFTCSLRYLRLDNVDGILPDRNILDLKRFKVPTPHSFANKVDFSDQIGDLISHHATTTHIRVNEQGMRRGTKQRFKGFFQIDQTPIAKDAELEESSIDSPEERISISICYIVGEWCYF